LSNLDTAAGNTFATLRKVLRARSEPPTEAPRQHVIDLDLLELWCTKSAISIVNLTPSALVWHPNRESANSPPEPIVRAVFGLAELPGHMGLYEAPSVGSRVGGRDVSFTAVSLAGNQFAGAAFELLGFRFFLSLHDDAMPSSPPFLQQLPASWSTAKLSRTLQQINQERAGQLSDVVDLKRSRRIPLQ
jgi:hypothetical protein